MFCVNCGSQVEDTTKFCPACGKAVSAPQAAAAGTDQVQYTPAAQPYVQQPSAPPPPPPPYAQPGYAAVPYQQAGIAVQGPQMLPNQPSIVIQNVQSAQQPAALAREYKNPGIALLLSVVFPGGGQFYNGHAGKGILVLLTFWLVIPYIWSWFDAYHCANRINRVGF